MTFETTLPPKAPSPRLAPMMLASPYWRRSVLRPTIFVALACLALLAFYNQARLREQTIQLQEVVSDSLINFYQEDRTHNNTLYQDGTEDRVVKEFDFGRNPCNHFPNSTDNILLVMKTGASEVFDKLPTHLLTDLQCLPEFLLFSDREQQIGQWHVYNALDAVTDKVMKHNPEFDLYRTQEDCPVALKSCMKTYRGQAGTAAWSLDKYKFMHILERSWYMRPNQSWYVFAEADTYIVWPNLVEWLRTRSPVEDPLEEPFYVGSAAMLAGIPFAHGGSGYLLSGALVRNLIEGKTGVSELYDIKARGHCCGDQLLAKAVLETQELKVRNGHPMFNGEKPVTFPFGPTHWCDPVLTMHHMEPEEISALWQYEQTRTENGTLLMRDLYKTFIANKMVDRRTHWDNLSDDICYVDPDPAVFNHVDDKMKKRLKKTEDMNMVEKDAHKSLEHCARVCDYEGYVDAVIEVDDDEEEEESQEYGEREQEAASGGPFKASNDESSDSVVKQDGVEKRDESLEAQAAEALAAPKKKKTQAVLRPTKGSKNPLARRCFQYRYQKGVCCTSRSFKLGNPRREAFGNAQDKLEEIWHSGWHLNHINAWIEAMGECTTPKWKVPDKL